MICKLKYKNICICGIQYFIECQIEISWVFMQIKLTHQIGGGELRKS